MLGERLLNAAKAGELVHVRYFGGSTPGAERKLRPISVEDGKVRALCLQSGETKLFVIDKLEEIVEGVPSAMATTPPLPPPATFQSLEEFTAHHRQAFLAQGWIVQHEASSLSLHRAFKNGKVIQAPDVALTFETETYDLVFDGEEVIEANHRERSRPWTLRGKGKTTKTFSDATKAQLCMLDWGRQLAPKAA